MEIRPHIISFFAEPPSNQRLLNRKKTFFQRKNIDYYIPYSRQKQGSNAK